MVKPCGQVVFELMGSKVSKAHENQFIADEHMRMSMKSKHNLPEGYDTAPDDGTHTVAATWLTAVKISRATAHMDSVKKFYTAEIGVKMEVNKQYDDGSELAIFTFNYPDNVGVQLHFWAGRKSKNDVDEVAKAAKAAQ